MKAFIEKKYEMKQKEATEKQEGKYRLSQKPTFSLGTLAHSNGQNEFHSRWTWLHYSWYQAQGSWTSPTSVRFSNLNI